VGCEARKRPAVGEVFFIDFYLYRTYQELVRKLPVQTPCTIQYWKYITPT